MTTPELAIVAWLSPNERQAQVSYGQGYSPGWKPLCLQSDATAALKAAQERIAALERKIQEHAAKRPDETATLLYESDFQPVYCVPDGEGTWEHHDKRVPLADQEVLYRSLRYMPSELAAAQERGREIAAGLNIEGETRSGATNSSTAESPSPGEPKG